VARKLLSNNKAIGLDLLPDTYFKHQQIWDAAKEKILLWFNRWFQGERIPKYLKQARIMALSKDPNKSRFP
jgi:hypothetical protein